MKFGWTGPGTRLMDLFGNMGSASIAIVECGDIPDQNVPAGGVKLDAPYGADNILRDLTILPLLRGMRFKAGDLPIVLNAEPNAGYVTLQELLNDLRTLVDRYDEELWISKQAALIGHSASMPTARLVRAMLPGVVKEYHRKVGGLVAQLSYHAKECLKAGVPIQDIEDSWDLALQEENYTYLHAAKD